LAKQQPLLEGHLYKRLSLQDGPITLTDEPEDLLDRCLEFIPNDNERTRDSGGRSVYARFLLAARDMKADDPRLDAVIELLREVTILEKIPRKRVLRELSSSSVGATLIPFLRVYQFPKDHRFSPAVTRKVLKAVKRTLSQRGHRIDPLLVHFPMLDQSTVFDVLDGSVTSTVLTKKLLKHVGHTISGTEHNPDLGIVQTVLTLVHARALQEALASWSPTTSAEFGLLALPMLVSASPARPELLTAAIDAILAPNGLEDPEVALIDIVRKSPTISEIAVLRIYDALSTSDDGRLNDQRRHALKELFNVALDHQTPCAVVETFQKLHDETFPPESAFADILHAYNSLKPDRERKVDLQKVLVVVRAMSNSEPKRAAALVAKLLWSRGIPCELEQGEWFLRHSLDILGREELPTLLLPDSVALDNPLRKVLRTVQLGRLTTIWSAVKAADKSESPYPLEKKEMVLRIALQSDDLDLVSSIATDLNLQNSRLATVWRSMLTAMTAFAKVGNIAAVQDILENLAVTGNLPPALEQIVPFNQQVCRTLVETVDPTLLLKYMETWAKKYGLIVIGPSTFDRILQRMVSTRPSIDCASDVAKLLRLDRQQDRPVGVRAHTMLHVFRALVTADHSLSSSSFKLFKLVHAANPGLVSKELCLLLQNISTQNARWRDLNRMKWQARLYKSRFGRLEARAMAPFKAKMRWQLLERLRIRSKWAKDMRLRWHSSDTILENQTDAGFSMRLREKRTKDAMQNESLKVRMELMMLARQPREVTKLFESLLGEGKRPTKKIVWLAAQAKLEGHDLPGALKVHADAQQSGCDTTMARAAILQHLVHYDPDPVRGLWLKVEGWCEWDSITPAHKRSLVALATLKYLKSPLSNPGAALNWLRRLGARPWARLAPPPGMETYKAYLAAYAGLFDWRGVDWAITKMLNCGAAIEADALLLVARLRRDMCKELLELAGKPRWSGRGCGTQSDHAQAYLRQAGRGDGAAAAAGKDEPKADAEEEQDAPPPPPPPPVVRDAVRDAWRQWKLRERTLERAAQRRRATRAARAAALLRALAMHGDGAGPAVRLVGARATARSRRQWSRRLHMRARCGSGGGGGRRPRAVVGAAGLPQPSSRGLAALVAAVGGGRDARKTPVVKV
jgi:hypothetical protein